MVAAIAFVFHIASNFAGPAGTPTFTYAAATVVALGAVAYLVGLLTFRRRKPD